MPLPNRFNWKQSRAHLLLLSKYDEGRPIDDIPYPRENWFFALGEKPQDAIERFITDGILEELGLERKLSRKFSLSDVKIMCKQRGLKVSGRKNELIQRLINADRPGMEKMVASLQLIGLTKQGELLDRQFRESCKQEELETIQEILSALRNHKFELASAITVNFRLNQVHFSGFYAHPQLSDKNRLAKKLKEIFDAKPVIYNDLKDCDLEILKITAAFLELSFEPPKNMVPNDFSPNIRIKDMIWAARAILCACEFQETLTDFKIRRAEYLASQAAFGNESEFNEIYEILGTCEYVYIQTPKDEYVCPECQSLSKKKYRLEEVPELPFVKCTSINGCRCYLVNESISYDV